MKKNIKIFTTLLLLGMLTSCKGKVKDSLVIKELPVLLATDLSVLENINFGLEFNIVVDSNNNNIFDYEEDVIFVFNSFSQDDMKLAKSINKTKNIVFIQDKNVLDNHLYANDVILGLKNNNNAKFSLIRKPSETVFAKNKKKTEEIMKLDKVFEEKYLKQR